jgi:ferredoxin
MLSFQAGHHGFAADHRTRAPARGRRKGRDHVTRLDEFVRIFELPPAMVPYVDYVVDEREMDLVLTLGDDELTLEAAAEALGMPLQEAEDYLTTCYYREIIRREKGDDGVVRYSAATFYERLNPLSMYENWGDVPAEARDAVLEWQLDEFIQRHQESIDQLQDDGAAMVRIPNRDVLLLEEALEIVDAAETFVIIPCDCHAIVTAADKPAEVCVRLDEGARMTLEHGQGREVTKEEMKAIVIDTDRAGLMHTGWREWRDFGRVFGFCNCGAEWCYPFRAGDKLGLHRDWPRAHYVAQRDLEACTHCGLCTRRCQFDAFYRDGSTIEIKGKERRAVSFDADLCVGCGLCANACPVEAIAMAPLADREAQAEASADLASPHYFHNE